MDAVFWLENHLLQWHYGNDDMRLNPEKSGYTDCSGGVYCAYDQAHGVQLGTWTGSQQLDGVEIWRGYSLDDMPWEQMERGDIILMTAENAAFNFAVYAADVQLYTGIPGHTIGCGATSGNIPRYFDGAQIDVYGGSRCFMVRRVLDDMATPNDIWAFTNEGQPPTNRTVGGNHTAYWHLVKMYDKVANIEKKVEQLETAPAATTAPAIDYDKLAKAILKNSGGITIELK